MKSDLAMLQELILGIVVATTASSALAQTARHPNVLFILTDDQGSVDVNCYGSHDLVTPNMDAIAAAGTRFTQFEAAAPICSPSRAAILTGKYPPRVGLPTHSASSLRGGNDGMLPAAVTIAEIFKAAGYATAHFGKWHLGYVPEQEPNAQGFDESFGFMGGCLDNYSHYFYWVGPNRHDLWHNGTEVWHDGQYLPDMLAADCSTFIEQHQDKPFLIYWAINQPHYPLQGSAKWREHYKDYKTPRREYAEAVSTADEEIGTVMAKLESLHLLENTVVCFMSDQGHSTEGAAFGGGGSAGPYRGAKFSLFEGGTRVPAMISWRGHLPAGQVRDQLVSGCDWLPTLAELCDVPIPKDNDLDGRSMMPIVRSSDAKTAHPVLQWETENNEWAVRDGDWKLIGNPLDPTRKGKQPTLDALWLSNLATDIGEKTNFAESHHDLVKKLQQMHRDWIRQVNIGPVDNKHEVAWIDDE